MSRKYKFRDQDKLHFVSFATVYWLDAAMELFLPEGFTTTSSWTASSTAWPKKTSTCTRGV